LCRRQAFVDEPQFHGDTLQTIGEPRPQLLGKIGIGLHVGEQRLARQMDRPHVADGADGQTIDVLREHCRFAQHGPGFDVLGLDAELLVRHDHATSGNDDDGAAACLAGGDNLLSVAKDHALRIARDALKLLGRQSAEEIETGQAGNNEIECHSQASGRHNQLSLAHVGTAEGELDIA